MQFENSLSLFDCVHLQRGPHQAFVWHDAGKVDHLQMGRLRDQRV